MKRIVFKIAVCTVVGLLGFGGVSASMAVISPCQGDCCCMTTDANTGHVIQPLNTAHACCNMPTAFTPCQWRQSPPKPSAVTLVSTNPGHEWQLNPEMVLPSELSMVQKPAACNRIGAPAENASSDPPLFISNQTLLC